MRILKENTLCLIIDFQEKLYPHIFQNEQLTKNVEVLLKGIKALNIPLLITEQYPKGIGATIEPIKKLVNDLDVIEKLSFSCCDESVFSNQLAQYGKQNIIITGIEAHVCVLQTVIDLIDYNYQPIVIEDCVSSRTENNKKIAIERMRQEGAVISTYESVLFELLRYSKTDAFKAISKLVK